MTPPKELFQKKSLELGQKIEGARIPHAFGEDRDGLADYEVKLVRTKLVELIKEAKKEGTE